jgi:hypothetical protein
MARCVKVPHHERVTDAIEERVHDPDPGATGVRGAVLSR